MFISFKTVRNFGVLAMVTIVVVVCLISFNTTGKITRGISVIMEKDRLELRLTDDIRQHFIDVKDVFIAFLRGEEKRCTNPMKAHTSNTTLFASLIQ